MTDIAVTPPRRGRGRGYGFPHPLGDWGCGLPSPTGPTPTAITDTPPWRGRGLRTSPHRRGRGLWEPANPEGKRPETTLLWMSKDLPLTVVGTQAPPQEYEGSIHTIQMRGNRPWQPQGYLHTFPMSSPYAHIALHPLEIFHPPRLYESPPWVPWALWHPIWTSHWPASSIWLDGCFPSPYSLIGPGYCFTFPFRVCLQTLSDPLWSQ